MNKKARLLFTSKCNRNCKQCCNKSEALIPPKIVTYKELLEYDEINITGGEPLLFPIQLYTLLKNLKEVKPTLKLWLYTAEVNPVLFMDWLDGCTITLHSRKDKIVFEYLQLGRLFPNKQMRLNSFVGAPKTLGAWWRYKSMKWIKDCPLPEGEDFVALLPTEEELQNKKNFFLR